MSTNRQRIDKYELRERLGYSALAETWTALDTQTQRTVVIKIYARNQPDLQVQLLRNGQAVASLQHPNIVHIDAIQTSGPPQAGSAIVYLVMEYIEGPTLAEYIAQTSGMKKFPPAADIVHLFASMSSAIDYAHQHGVIHRNIRPSNILLNKQRITQNRLGEPMLTDFRIAELLNTSFPTPAHDVLRPGTGTLLYLSPEQAKGYIGNELSDIYALGVILYEVCTGIPPFQGENPNAIMWQHINAMPHSPVLINPMIPPALAEVILHSIARDPAMRYSNASSMASALADAFNLSVPENLIVPDFLADQMSAPTFFKPFQTNPLPHQTPSSRSSPIIQSPAAAPSQQSAASLRNTPGTPFTRGGGISGVIFDNSISDWSTIAASPRPSPIQHPFTPSPPAPERRRKGLIVTLIAVLVFVLAGSGLGAFLLLNHATPTPVANPIVGYAYFVSSGQVDENNNQGINDELLVELHNIPNPAPGKNYYAWLLSDKSQVDGTAILFGTFTVNHGNVHFLYPGDALHTNLLAIASRFLITEEDANITPTNPSPDRSTWMYYAELPQMPDPGNTVNHLSMLDHLRDLLTDDPTLKQIGLSGGLDMWLYRNTEKILEWSGSARDYFRGNNSHMRDQFIRILDYLDGVSSVQGDLPPGTPVLVNLQQGSTGLLKQNPVSPSFLQEIGGHLTAIVQAPGITPDRSKFADQVDTAINNVRNWLEHVYQDVKQLNNMTDPQLRLPSSLTTLDDMVNYALSAYVGRLDPSTSQIQEGVVQIHESIQRLATFDITAYISQ